MTDNDKCGENREAPVQVPLVLFAARAASIELEEEIKRELADDNNRDNTDNSEKTSS